MQNIKIELNKGISNKSQKPYYSVRFICGKYVSEPLFISELEYDYLVESTKDLDFEE